MPTTLVHDPTQGHPTPDAHLDRLEATGDVGLAFRSPPDPSWTERLRDRGHPWALLVPATGHVDLPRLNLAAGDPDYRRRSVRLAAELLARASAGGAHVVVLPIPQALEETTVAGRPGVPISLERARDGLWRSLDVLASVDDRLPVLVQTGNSPDPGSPSGVPAGTWEGWLDHLAIPHVGLANRLLAPPTDPERLETPGRWVKLCRFVGRRWDAAAWERWGEALEAHPAWSRPDWCVGSPPVVDAALLRALRRLPGRSGS
ncbi:MAG: hypothetical protein VKP72_08435 [bacterium]|nr:hypothetical protein [bacterium]